MFEKRVLRRIFGARRGRWWETEEDRMRRSFITCTFH
jgi:hypothetical protein